MKRCLFLLVVLLAASAGAAPGQGCPAGASWCSGLYQYDGMGNIRAIGGDIYIYDTVGRLVSGSAEVQRGGASRQDYAYDPFGNRTGASRSAGSVECLGGCEQSAAIDPLTNHITSNGAQYDPAGNLISITNTVNGTSFTSTYDYDAAGSMARATAGSDVRQFIYTADEERIATRSGQSWTWTVRDLDNKVLREYTSAEPNNSPGLPITNRQWAKDYVWRDGLLLASVAPTTPGASTTLTQHYHLDHLGTPRVISNDAGVETSMHAYYPFGAGLNLGPEPPPGGRLKFTGHEREVRASNPNTLDYMHARYYSPTFGRFLSVDPEMESAYTEIPQSWNRYLYVMNNPLKYIDLTGREITCVTVKDDKGNDQQICSESVDVQGDEPKVSEVTPVLTARDFQETDLSGLLRKRDERERVRNKREEQRVSNCYDQNRFSSLFGNGVAGDVVGFLEIGSEISLAGDTVATGYKATQASLGDQAYGSAMNWAFRRIGNAAGNPALKKSLTKFGDRATPALAVFGAFTAGYNASIYVQCRQGLL